MRETRKDPIVWDVFPLWNTLTEPVYYEEADRLFTPQGQGLVSRRSRGTTSLEARV